MPTLFKKIQGALCSVCFFLPVQSYAINDSLSPSVAGNSEFNIVTNAPVEFETYIVRYATHFPTSNFEKTLDIAKGSVRRFCQEFNLKGNSCLTEIGALSIEGLIQLTAHLKKGLSDESSLSINDVDLLLLKVAIKRTDDPYTIMLRKDADVTGTPSNEQSEKSELSEDGLRLKITNFDSDNGCVAESLLSHPEKIRSLDLRDNHGGDLECTIKILSGFLPKGRHHIATLFTMDGEEALWVEGSLDDNELKKRSLFVNKHTASSAEIFAHNLIENGWDVDGLPMKGKRSIQAKFDTPYGSYMLTIGKFEINNSSK
ncbi:S41 family peptidase [Photobacterium galatheae]|uniref:Tail specific protease domain-containing protein n=1 Tax=Photobacterium galatheae TaxID=1654360 RepID=A0A066RNZ0_9GAMM|nr:S41 family peptidase [Photobacterium galatheae]KDM90821.1 hypothetical protein EA58_13755 [Photobacterium galatheae]MCM0149211.1 hypothetical protein [Photobacterium galatheae]